MTCENKDTILEIKSDIHDIKENLAEHMSRTAANEARLELMENFLQKQVETNNQTMQQFIEQSKENSTALNKQLKIALGLFSALAVLIAALWKVSQ
jgi:polyhydroxyalkanoate synthesis regulator protein